MANTVSKSLPKAQAKPAPKLHSTPTRPAEAAQGDEHEERLIDEALDESFPASDPAAIVNPGSAAANRKGTKKKRP